VAEDVRLSKRLAYVLRHAPHSAGLTLDRAGWTGFRRQAASADRPLEHVAPEEVGNAMVALCRDAEGLAEDELFVRTAEVFGYRRRTPSLTPLLQAALARVLGTGRLVRSESGVLTAP